MRPFDKNELICVFEQIKRQKAINVFYQPTRRFLGDDIFVFNFSNYYSLHVACFVRVTHRGQIILTSSDQYATINYERLKKYDEKNFIKKTLLKKTLSQSKKMLKNAHVKNIEISEVGDVNIEFDNDVNIEILIDCQQNDYEYYRIFDSSTENLRSTIVGFANDNIVFL